MGGFREERLGFCPMTEGSASSWLQLSQEPCLWCLWDRILEKRKKCWTGEEGWASRERDSTVSTKGREGGGGATGCQADVQQLTTHPLLEQNLLWCCNTWTDPHNGVGGRCKVEREAERSRCRLRAVVLVCLSLFESILAGNELN